MSLINDALKKAQKQRTGETPALASMPSVGGESPQRIARRAKPAGFDSLMLRAGIGLGVVLVLGVGGLFLFRDKPAAVSSQPSAASSHASPPISSPPAQQPTTNNLQLAPAPTPATPAFTLPLAPAPGSVSPAPGGPSAPAASANVGGTSRPDASVASSPPAASSPQTPDPKPQAPIPVPIVERPKLEPRAIEFIENIKVAGIRASSTDPKVLMNDRVYRPGNQVSAEFGLKLVEIASGALTFEDEQGGRYTRTF